MRSIVSIWVLVAALCPVVSVAGEFGSVFGSLATAQSYGQGRGTLGGAVGIAEGNSVAGWFGYGMSKYIDGRIKLGFWDAGANAQLSLGADAKWQFWSVADGARYPIDMAIGGFIEYQEMSRFSVLHIGSHLVGSYPFKLYRGGTLSPYGRANLRLESTSADNKTDIKFGLSGGAAWDATATMRFYGEFQLDGNNGVFFGVEFNVM
jgi:hypothetical protein